MRGKILGFDAATGQGAISGSDGKRYNFAKSEWRGDGEPTPGIYTDFDSADGVTATALFPEVKTVFQPGRMADAAPPPPPPPPPPAPPPPPPPPAASQGNYPGQAPQSGGWQPGGAPNGAPSPYPQPAARPPYPGQAPAAPAYPGQQAQTPPAFPGQGQPSPPPYPGQGGYPGQAQPGQQYQKSKIVAGLLALFLGSWGVHKFYLGYTTEGFIMLGATIASFVLTIILIGFFGLMAVGIVAFIEAIMYLTKSDEDFDRIYVQHKKAWF